MDESGVSESDGAGLTGRQKLLRGGVALFVLLAIACFAIALVEAWDQTSTLPGIWRLVTAGLLCAIGLLSVAWSWATLLGGNRRLDHVAAALVSQIAKYVPGGIWQASGQIGLARSAGVAVKRGMVAFTVQAIVFAVSAASFGIVLASVWDDGAAWLRILIALGSLASLALIDRRWMVWVLHKIPRTRDASNDLVPPQRSIILAIAQGVVAVATLAIGYAVVLGGFGPLQDPWLVVSAFAIAWLVGFVLVPLPSGLGAREAVLIGLLHGLFPTSVLVAASVFHRIVQIVTEGVLALIAAHRVRPSRLRAAALPLEDLS
jgi:uncharacterized membrane protein YbhN (UPF0104 family)